VGDCVNIKQYTEDETPFTVEEALRSALQDCLKNAEWDSILIIASGVNRRTLFLGDNRKRHDQRCSGLDARTGQTGFYGVRTERG
jgi:hypothetical protein